MICNKSIKKFIFCDLMIFDVLKTKSQVESVRLKSHLPE